MNQFSSVLSYLNKNRSIIALQDASISLVPMILTVTFLLMLSKALSLVSSSPIIGLIGETHHYFYVFFPLIFTISLAVSFAKSKDVDPTALVIICVCILLLSAVNNIHTLQQLKESTYFKIVPIPLCYFTATLLRYFAKKTKWHLFEEDFMSFHLNKTFNYILPSAITFILIFTLFMLFEAIWQSVNDYGASSQFRIEDTSNLLNVIMLKFLYKLTWFFGVNPSHIFSFLNTPYFDALIENQAAFESGLAIPHINVSGNYFFTDIGGAGSAFCLLLSILFYSKSNRHKRLAKLSVLPCSFNISEILHYGLPIVFNPFLFIPFILVPILLSLNVYLFMSFDLVSPVVASVPWTTPPLLNVYLATGGDFSAVLLQLLNLAIGVIIYLKFLRMLEASHLDESLVKDFIDKFNLETRNIQALQYRNQQSLINNLKTENEVNSVLLALSQGELELHYQPILNTKTKQITKVEALLRLRDKQGNVLHPTFINVLSKVGLFTDIDRWVVRRAVKQSHDWTEKIPGIEISINISPISLLDRDFINFLIEMHNKSIHPFCVEILENHVVFEELRLNEHLKILKTNGITIYLDDFGSGFSALSMLSRLNITGVKYDIDFTNQLHNEAGSKLFNSCLNISQSLEHKTVLEGVETKEQYDVAIESKVDYIQGFYISKPLHHDDLIAFIESNRDLHHQAFKHNF